MDQPDHAIPTVIMESELAALKEVIVLLSQRKPLFTEDIWLAAALEAETWADEVPPEWSARDCVLKLAESFRARARSVPERDAGD